jgi:hypothetical protein
MAHTVHTLVDGLAEAAIPRTSHHYLVDPSKAKGAAKALLYAAFGAAAWNAQSALLQSHLSFAGAPAIESPVYTGRRKLCRHLQRRPVGDPHAGRSPEHQLQRHLGAPRQPPGCRRLALGLSRVCGWDWDGWGAWRGFGLGVAVMCVLLLAHQIKRLCKTTR